MSRQAMKDAADLVRNGYVEQAYALLIEALEQTSEDDEPAAIFEATTGLGEGLPYRGIGRIKKLKFIPVGAELYLKRGAA